VRLRSRGGILHRPEHDRQAQMSDPKHTTSEKKRVERMNRFLRTIALLLFLPFAAASADMLAPTPQMGFNNWYSTFCRSEFNEEMIRGVADKMVTLGLKDAGYMHGGPRTAKRLTFNTPLMGGYLSRQPLGNTKLKGE